MSSARPRVTRKALALSPTFISSAMPAAMATTFLSAPHSSMPSTSVPAKTIMRGDDSARRPSLDDPRERRRDHRARRLALRDLGGDVRPRHHAELPHAGLLEEDLAHALRGSRSRAPWSRAAPGARGAARSPAARQTSRKACEGMAISTTSASSMRRPRASVVASTRSWMRSPLTAASLVCAWLISSRCDGVARPQRHRAARWSRSGSRAWCPSSRRRARPMRRLAHARLPWRAGRAGAPSSPYPSSRLR